MEPELFNASGAVLHLNENDNVIGIRRLSWCQTRGTVTKKGKGLRACTMEDWIALDWILVFKKKTINDLAVHYASTKEASGNFKSDLIDAFLAGASVRIKKEPCTETPVEEPIVPVDEGTEEEPQSNLPDSDEKAFVESALS